MPDLYSGALGVGILLLLLKEALAIAQRKRNGGSAGEKNTDYWRIEMSTIARDANAPILALLEALRKRMDENQDRLVEIAVELRVRGGR